MAFQLGPCDVKGCLYNHGVTSTSRNRRGTGDLRLADSEAPNALGPRTRRQRMTSPPGLAGGGIHKALSRG